MCTFFSFITHQEVKLLKKLHKTNETHFLCSIFTPRLHLCLYISKLFFLPSSLLINTSKGHFIYFFFYFIFLQCLISQCLLHPHQMKPYLFCFA